MTDRHFSSCAWPEQQGRPWFSAIELSLPFWQDFRGLIQRLREEGDHGPGLPGIDQLQRMLPEDVSNRSGRCVTFVPSHAVMGVPYEANIFTTGEISTRKNNWHDLFNALVWARFPRLKSAMNALHWEQMCRQNGTQRSRLRDALTLLDECGVIVAGTNRELLEDLRHRNWQSAFRAHAASWQKYTRVFVCGHALLEKFLKPYKALTAHALLLRLPRNVNGMPRHTLLRALDAALAERLLAGALFDSPAGLSPLPLMGIPGWWPDGEQDEAFYADGQVFRRPAAGSKPAPVFDFPYVTAHQEMP